MREEAFRSWLSRSRNYSSGTVSSRVSNCKTVERYEGDLVLNFDRDYLNGLINRLTYSSDDQVRNHPARHKIPIKRNVYTGSATLKTAVSLYKQFREEWNEGEEILPKTLSRPRAQNSSSSSTTPAIRSGLALSSGTVLQNRYRILRHLDAGGMGSVYEAVDQRLSSIVALKETLTETPEMSRAFEREASLLANLSHPALPVVTDHFLDAGGQFLVMQFVKGDDLGTQLEKRGQAFPVHEVLKWADQLLDALEYLHLFEPPIIHRDIKPLNIKLGRRGEAILLDFGLAKGALGQMRTMTGGASVFGFSPRYAPLEQIHGAGTDPRSDIYSLGATLYHLITGIVPVDAPTRYNAIEEGRSDPLQPAQKVSSEVTENISDVIAKAMAISRRDRWSSANEMRAALRIGIASGFMPAVPADAPPTAAVQSSDEDETRQRIVYFNNCQNRDHVRMYGRGAFYDLNTTGFQSTLARNLSVGQKCIVASTGDNGEIVFTRFSFLREDVMLDDRGIPCRVFFGAFIKSESYSKTAAASKKLFSAFFDINGNFKRHSVIETVTGSIRTTEATMWPTRSNTTEKEFLERLENKSPDERNVAKRILEWSRQNFSRVDWKRSSFVPVLEYGAEFSHNPITVYAVGKVPRVGIKFGRMKNRNGFSEEKRKELFRRLNDIPGVHLPSDSFDKYPNILLSTLARGDALEQFLQAIAWTLDEVKSRFVETKELTQGLISTVTSDVPSGRSDRDLTAVISDAQREFWIVLWGDPDHSPSEDEQIFDASTYDQGFPVKPASIKVGDILFVHRIHISKIIYVGEVLSAPRKSSIAEAEEEEWRRKWNWSVSTRNLTPEYGKHWRERGEKTFDLLERYNQMNPNNRVSISRLKFGRHVRIPRVFAHFLSEQIAKTGLQEV